MPDEMEEITAEFITESFETLDKVEPLFVELEAKGQDKEILNRIFRCVHTIKGAAGFLGFQPVVDVAHSAENIMKKLREGEVLLSRPLTDAVLKGVDMLRLLLRHIKEKDGVSEDTAPLLRELSSALENAQKTSARQVKAEKKSEVAASQGTPTAAGEAIPAEKKESLQTLRVDVDKIDKVLNLTGEVVLVRNRLLNIANRLELSYAEDREISNLIEAVSFLDLITSDMQLGVMKMRMQPIQKVFSKFPRLVRDIAGPLGKTVELKITGEDTEVDKSVIEQIGDTMVHIIRNAIDHGIETPAERQAQGKPEKGTISISAAQKGNQIIIEVSDDGRGINLEKVKKKAVEKGIITQDEAVRMSDDSAVNMIFLPGFSTAEFATELSGRGVGMDVVKTNISRLNGSVEVGTQKGIGSAFTIHIPLTLAIIQTLMVRSDGSRYAVPLAPVEETIMISKEDISDIGGTDALVIRGRAYPLFELSAATGAASKPGAMCKYAVVVSIGDRRFCIGVDELLGQEEVVIKTVDGVNTGSSYILGATITGDGKVVFILDLAALSRSALGLVKA